MRYPLASMGLLAGIALLACGDDDPSQSVVNCVTAPEVFSGEFAMDFAFEDGRARFSVGEPIRMRLSVINCADEDLSLKYPTTQRYDLVITSADNASPIWKWSNGKVFAPVNGEETFEAGETKTYTEVWDQKSDSGEQAAVGNYLLTVHALPCESVKIADCESSTGLGITFEIRVNEQLTTDG